MSASAADMNGTFCDDCSLAVDDADVSATFVSASASDMGGSLVSVDSSDVSDSVCDDCSLAVDSSDVDSSLVSLDTSDADDSIISENVDVNDSHIDSSNLEKIDDSHIDSSNLDSKYEIQGLENSVSEENIKIGIDPYENIDLNDLINSTSYKITQTSENTFIITYPDNTTSSLCRVGICDLDSFKKVSALISKNNVSYDILIIEFADNLNLAIDPWSNELLNPKNFKSVVINGHGSTVSIKNPKPYQIYHFLNVASSVGLALNNMTLSGFNTAILNYGQCQLKNVVFEDNVIDFRIIEETSPAIIVIHSDEYYEQFIDHKGENDDGGAIRNFGILECEGCSFINSLAHNGGAIYNEVGTQSTFINCRFKGNKVYLQVNIASPLAKPQYTYDYDGGFYGDAHNKQRLGSYTGFDSNNNYDIYTAKMASCLVYSDNDTIYCVCINSTQDLINFINNEKDINYMKYCILNFLPGVVYNIGHDFEAMKFTNIENLYIMGNGATINVKDRDDNYECHFLEINPSSTVVINDLILSGFNRAIINKGTLSISNSTFKNNRCDYVIAEDYGGAIYNNHGLVSVYDSRFENGYAKYGGAIYNNAGILISNNCNFTSNEAYGNGGAVYNENGFSMFKNCIFTNNRAEKGGAIFNHYGKVSALNNIFNGSVAEDEGGAIYNDYGELVLGNDTFINSRADEGKDVYSYGEEAKYSIVSQSYSIQQTGNVISNQTMKVTSDAPSEIARWAIRIGEVALCVALCVGCSLAGVPEASAGVICFFGGCLLAGAEEIIEECCFEHSFNLCNVFVMMVIAGVFDSVGGALGSWVGLTFFSTATVELSAKESFKLGAICLGIELAGEVLTEALPRMDFRNLEVPSYLIDPSVAGNQTDANVVPV